ncbi:DUF2795 domain-containing protein [Methanolobus halotolerans]|uniref:DUF2795 domain-containing protein n=1 Tax=Methanolobus halotolerans TaxID=2052935 RepID=A0A4E0R102_9EURY|nr:DUF2795 domain-containing protein [Methanolobus halotolerans]TGC10706.1 hypothetical protein CUN85_04345 [Methanolobus halotolerans]
MRSNAAEVEKALWGMDYPKRKQEIIEYARQHDASDNIMSELRSISEKAYTGPEQISRELESNSSKSSSSKSSQDPMSGSSKESSDSSYGGSSQGFGGRGGA